MAASPSATTAPIYYLQAGRSVCPGGWHFVSGFSFGALFPWPSPARLPRVDGGVELPLRLRAALDAQTDNPAARRVLTVDRDAQGHAAGRTGEDPSIPRTTTRRLSPSWETAGIPRGGCEGPAGRHRASEVSTGTLLLCAICSSAALPRSRGRTRLLSARRRRWSSSKTSVSAYSRSRRLRGRGKDQQDASRL